MKKKFALATLALALAFLAAGALGIRWYSAHLPWLSSAYPSLVSALQAGVPSPYDGLKASSLEPEGIYYRNRVLVLMYHDVSTNPADDKSLALEKFDRQLELMKGNNFHWISMDAYRDFVLRSVPVPDNAVLLTFDDGYESLYGQAYPALRKYGAPASAFLIARTVGDPNDPFPRVTWDQAREMQSSGLVSFHSHTFDSHRYVPTEANGAKRMSMIARRIYLKDKGRKENAREYEDRVTADLKQANDLLRQELGLANRTLAFPYGAFSGELLEAGKKLGIDVTFTVKPGLNGPGRTNGYRLNAGGADNDPELQIALMKQAESRLDGARGTGTPARNAAFAVLCAILLLLAAYWLRCVRKLARAARSR